MVRRVDEEGSGRQEDRETRESAPFFFFFPSPNKNSRRRREILKLKCHCSLQLEYRQGWSRPLQSPISITIYSWRISMLCAFFTQTDELKPRANICFTGRSSNARLRRCVKTAFPPQVFRLFVAIIWTATKSQRAIASVCWCSSRLRRPQTVPLVHFWKGSRFALVSLRKLRMSKCFRSAPGNHLISLYFTVSFQLFCKLEKLLYIILFSQRKLDFRVGRHESCRRDIAKWCSDLLL